MKYFMPALGLLFITLKILEVINWSWWLVLLPIYGPAAIGLAVMIPLMIYIIKHG